jgi:hypothetical protein
VLPECGVFGTGEGGFPEFVGQRHLP